MCRTLLTLVVSLVTGAGSLAAQTPGSSARQSPSLEVLAAQRVAGAIAAVEGDSVNALRTAWERERAQRPEDPLPVLGLAALDRFTYRTAAAEAAYTSLIGADEELRRPESRLAAVGLGLTLAGAFRVPEADAWLARAAAAARGAGERLVEADALVVLASLRARSRGTVAALALLDRADSILPENSLLRAQAMCQRGLILVRVGDPRAVELAEEGADLGRAAGSTRVEAACVTVLAQDAERRGRTNEAFRHLREVRRLHELSGNLSGLAATLQWNGYLRSTYGQFGSAIWQLNEAREHAAASGNRSVEAWASLNLADIAVRLDDPVWARAHLTHADSLLGELNDLWGLATLNHVKGDAANVAGDLEEAEAAYERALELTRAGNPALGVTVVRKLAAVARRAGRLDQAESLLAEAARWAEELNMPGYALIEQPYALGVLALDRGAYVEAEARFRELLDRVQVTVNTHELRFDAQARLAEALLGQGDLAGAAVELSRALEELDGYRSNLEGRRFRLSVLHARKFDWDRDLGIAGIISALAADGRVEEALTLSEGQRARVLLERVARRSSLLDEAEERAPEEAAEEPVGRAPVAVFGAGGLQGVLAQDEAVVSFVTDMGGGPTTAFVLTTETLHAVALPPVDSFADDVDRFARLLSGGAEAATLAGRLGSLLLAPVVEHLPREVRRLMLVPDGALHRLPFEALRIGDGVLVLERFITSRAPSLSYITAHRRGGGPDPGGGSVLAFGDPTLPQDPGDDGPFALPPLVPTDLPRLPGSGREARTAAGYGSDSRLLLGSDATEAVLKAEGAGRADVLHFATHAVVEERSILRTALVLAPGGGEDGLVHPNEVAALDLDAALVVLSACETADGTVLAAEGMQGLVAPFLEAGAQAVVASHWPLGDEAIVALVRDFYDGMAEGAAVADALRGAKLRARELGASPRVWAALTVVGDGLARPAVERPGRWRPWVLIAVLVGLLAYGLGRPGGPIRRRRGAAETS